MPGPSSLRPSQVLAYGSQSLPTERCSTFRAQPIRVPSQGVSPSKRRAAAAIVAAKSPFHQPRPIFSTLMRQRGGQLKLVLANPRVPLAPDATQSSQGFRRLSRQSPATMRAAIRVHAASAVLYAIEKAACVTVTFACCINDRSVDELCPKNRRNSKASRLETIVQPESGSFIRGASKSLSHQLGCQSLSFAHTCIYARY